MYLFLFMLLNGQQPIQPWNLMVGRPSGQYLVWEHQNFRSMDECVEALSRVVPPALAYCERAPPIT